MVELFEQYERALKAPRATGRSARISGVGRIPGGVYESVCISGSGRVEGDIKVKRVSVAGSSRFQGGIEAEEISFAGSVRVDGDLRGGFLKAAGALSVSGVIECDEVRAAGDLRARAVRGQFVRLAGAFNVDEGVEAPLVELKLSGDSRCRIIRGERVTIEPSRGKAIFLRAVRRRRLALRVELLEADLVKARDVVVEGRVKVGRIELQGSAEIRGPLEGEAVKA